MCGFIKVWFKPFFFFIAVMCIVHPDLDKIMLKSLTAQKCDLPVFGPVDLLQFLYSILNSPDGKLVNHTSVICSDLFLPLHDRDRA